MNGVGGYDDCLGNMFEDYIPWMLLSVGNEGAWSPLPSLLYRKHDDNYTKKPNIDAKAIDKYVTEMEDLAAEIVSNGESVLELNSENLRRRCGRE